LHIYICSMKKKILLLLSIAFCLTIQGQNNTVSTGGDAEGSNGSISYSIGQVVYTSATGINGSINQGVQQPYNFDVITGIEHTEIELSIYPNPTIGQVNLCIADSRTQEYSLQLFDATGRLIMKNSRLNELNSFSMESYAAGAYTLSVYKKDEFIKSFRIIRNY
jgi:hypothetical protein